MTPAGIVIIGAICAVITFVLMILPTRTILRVLEVGFFLGLLAWVDPVLPARNRGEGCLPGCLGQVHGSR